jgi:hypothetical protein
MPRNVTLLKSQLMTVVSPGEMLFSVSAHNLLKGCFFIAVTFFIPKLLESQNFHDAKKKKKLEFIENINSLRTTVHS